MVPEYEKILSYFAKGQKTGTNKAEQLGKLLQNTDKNRRVRLLRELDNLHSNLVASLSRDADLDTKLRAAVAKQFLRETKEYSVSKTASVSYKNGKYWVIGSRGGILGGPYSTYQAAQKRDKSIASSKMNQKFVK